MPQDKFNHAERGSSDRARAGRANKGRQQQPLNRAHVLRKRMTVMADTSLHMLVKPMMSQKRMVTQLWEVASASMAEPRKLAQLLPTGTPPPAPAAALRCLACSVMCSITAPREPSGEYPPLEPNSAAVPPPPPPPLLAPPGTALAARRASGRAPGRGWDRLPADSAAGRPGELPCEGGRRGGGPQPP
ncbi:hypothetical protein TSOC_000231 [Tetrabaena socialis]|uniref:Uncharacterized protein n=1 Tax=Tetrabaena socialis TaxID=47790 RepID=A0A2J8AJX1_9CHLO|nr:hypothetical protein TSOC_000231 [Tetrabaena socialis]|eukprot:PNH12808.1 hypothetical protein TSOC_000231 [Tetrabaena socialis]